MKAFAIIILSLVILSGCASFEASKPQSEVKAFSAADTVEAREILLGKWYGEKRHDDGTFQKWLVNRLTDGSYLIEFHVTEPDGSVEKWAEIGIWGVRKPIYFTAMRGFVEGQDVQLADTSDPLFYDAYRIVELSSELFTYHSYTSGKVFTVRKVADDFEL